MDACVFFLFLSKSIGRDEETPGLGCGDDRLEYGGGLRGLDGPDERDWECEEANVVECMCLRGSWRRQIYAV
jgi:hypothetical protein